MDQKMITEPFALHVCRNPYGWDEDTVRECLLYICDRVEEYRDAYLNMREFAEENGLDTMVRGDLWI